MNVLGRIGGWLYDRAGVGPIHRFLSKHKVPPEVGGSGRGWFYVFGQALVFVFLLQVVTGTALATKYIASPDHAWESLRFLNTEVAWGGFVRGLHFFGASALVLLLFVHMARVFLTGSYKFPREMNWITGVVLLALVLTMALTGQLLRWDEDGVGTLMIVATTAGRAPFVGEHLMELILAGDTLGGATLSRFFAFHVIVLPLLIILFVGWHVYLVVHHGVSEPPRSGEPVDRERYRARYEAHKEEGRTLYFPDAAWREFVFVALVYSVVFALAFIEGPKGPAAAPDPAQLEADPRPDWFFLWYHALIWYAPAALDELVLVWFPLLALPALMLLPVLFPTGERSPARRPWAVFAVAATLLLWGTLTGFGMHPHWVPEFDPEPVPETALAGAPPEAVRGSDLFRERGCQYCHMVLDRGGRYGPELTHARARLSEGEMTVRIMLGLRDMPAYRDILSTDEVEAIVSYIAWIGRAAEEP